MDSITQDLLEIILAKLSLKNIATSKLVCKQWKSIVESKFFYKVFQSHHQDSHSLWSLMTHACEAEVIAYYGCNKTWGLTRSLGSYIFSFVTETFGLSRYQKQLVKVETCSDVGLILISCAESYASERTYYVANPISRKYVKIPPHPCSNETKFIKLSGLVTQVENDVVLSYKIVLVKRIRIKGLDNDISLLIYSSETCLWSLKTIPSPLKLWPVNPIRLNGNLYWIVFDNTLKKCVVVYLNFYATATESDRFRVIPLPGVEKHNKFERVFTTSQGYLMYLKVDAKDEDDVSSEHKLSVWRLKSDKWQLVSEISTDMNPSSDHILWTINPFDAKTVYIESKLHNGLASINLDNRQIVVENNLKYKYYRQRYYWEGLYDSPLHTVVLPRWLYRIPCSPESERASSTSSFDS